jgi:hypothetical protein
MSDSYNVGIHFTKEEKERMELFISQIHHVLDISLTKRQQKIFMNLYVLQIFKEHGVTVEGYLSFIQIVKELKKLTHLPFSLEDDYAELGTKENFHAAIDKAYETEKRNDRRRKKRAIQK